MCGSGDPSGSFSLTGDERTTFTSADRTTPSGPVVTEVTRPTGQVPLGELGVTTYVKND